MKYRVFELNLLLSIIQKTQGLFDPETMTSGTALVLRPFYMSPRLSEYRTNRDYMQLQRADPWVHSKSRPELHRKLQNTVHNIATPPNWCHIERSKWTSFEPPRNKNVSPGDQSHPTMGAYLSDGNQSLDFSYSI